MTPAAPHRRRALLLAAAGAAFGGRAHAVGPASSAADAAVRVADGVYMVRGSGGQAEAGNRGRTGNAGFIVGPAGVIAVETGTSYRHGLALLEAIAAVTAQPVKLAIVTHARQEVLFGAMAFRERGVPIAMQRDVAALMAARCDGCLKTLNRTLGSDEMLGSAMFAPDQLFDDALSPELIGRPVRALSFGHSSGPGDTAVLDVRTGSLFAGGLVDARRVPDVQDGDLPGWRAALHALQRLPLRHVVPGHGPPSTPAAIGAALRYLDRLEARVRALLRRDVALSAVPDAAALPEFAGWDQYPLTHRRNASILFVRWERDELLRLPAAAGAPADISPPAP